MIKISEKILHFEPHHWLAVLPDATVSFIWFFGAVHAGVPGLLAILTSARKPEPLSFATVMGSLRRERQSFAAWRDAGPIPRGGTRAPGFRKTNDQ
jgi:hypothetical protein